MLKIALLFPIFAGFETESVFSLFEAIQTAHQYIDKLEFLYFKTIRHPLWKARIKLWEVARYLDVQKAIFIGEDIVLNKDSLIRLILDNSDIVSALYFERTLPFRQMIFKRNEYGEWVADSVKIDGFKHEVEGCGLDCIAFSRCVLEKVDSNIFLPTYKSTGDDLSFCENLKRYGFKIMVDTGHIVGHVSQEKKIIRLQEHMRGWKEVFSKIDYHKKENTKE